MTTRRTPAQFPPIEIEYDGETPLRYRDGLSGICFTTVAAETKQGAIHAPDQVRAVWDELVGRDARYLEALAALEPLLPEGAVVERVCIDGVTELTVGVPVIGPKGMAMASPGARLKGDMDGALAAIDGVSLA